MILLDEIYDQAVALNFSEFKKFLPSSDTEEAERNSDRYRFIEELAYSENSIKALFDRSQYKVLRIWGSIENLVGYSLAEDVGANSIAKFAFKCFAWEHITFPIFAIKWEKEVRSSYKLSFTEFTIILCGIKMRHKNGNILRLLIRFDPVLVTESGFDVLNLISVYDITHLMKDDFYWGRWDIKDELNTVFHFRSSDKKNYKQDILSDREKEILLLYAKGYTIKEVSETLHITMNTINNHRKNMLLKTGARDVTSLIQICKMMGMF